MSNVQVARRLGSVFNLDALIITKIEQRRTWTLDILGWVLDIPVRVWLPFIEKQAHHHS
jgi:hypothetical protein